MALSLALALLMTWRRRRHRLGEGILGELGCPHPSMRGGASIGDGPRGSVIGVMWWSGGGSPGL